MSYDPDTDAFYLSLIEIPEAAVHRSEEVAPATVLDYEEDGNLLGIEVYAGVTERMDLSHLVTKGFSFGEYGGRSGTSTRACRSGYVLRCVQMTVSEEEELALLLPQYFLS